jgi:hypothetical protein
MTCCRRTNPPQYMPALTTLAGQPSLHQQAAAALAVQGNILQAIVTMHQRKGAERERHCREAVRCGYLSRDGTLTATALMYLGYTYCRVSARAGPSRPSTPSARRCRCLAARSPF